MEKEALYELLKKDLTNGCVYEPDGDFQKYYFEKSTFNIANFIKRNVAKLMEFLRGTDQMGVTIYWQLKGQIVLLQKRYILLDIGMGGTCA